jgi:DNA replication initiation complex subunit (GINS family)
MYDELCHAWKSEMEKTELEKLPPDFYPRVADYMKRLREEGRMLDKRTLKTSLLKKEMQNARVMIQRLIQTRYRKIVGRMTRGDDVIQDTMTPEEIAMYSKVLVSSEGPHLLVKEVIRGDIMKAKIEAEHKRVALRLLKEVPAVIGSDMKTYGPFKVEDVVTVPAENAKILVKQNLAVKLETD